MSADVVARFTLEQIQQDARYIFTHPKFAKKYDVDDVYR